MRVRQFLFYHAPAVLYCVLVFVLGALPAHPSAGSILGYDKVLHFIIFGVMVLVIHRSLRAEYFEKLAGVQVAASVAIAAVLGALLELVQWTMPHRSAELWDWIADALGALTAGLFISLVMRRKPTLAGPPSE